MAGWSVKKYFRVVGLMLIIAAGVLIALPKLFAGHGCFLVNNAMNNMRSLPVGVMMYQQTYGTYPPSLAALGPPPAGQPLSADAAGYIDPSLASGNYVGYLFRYTLKKPLRNGGRTAGYVIVADPIVGGPGRQHYYVSEDAILRSEETKRATAQSPANQADGCVCW